MNQVGKQRFLSGQRLSMLQGIDDPDERRVYIFGAQAQPPKPESRRQALDQQPWQPIPSRDELG